jgi:hypothetical protein
MKPPVSAHLDGGLVSKVPRYGVTVRRDLPPYSMGRINKDPDTLYTDLSNAGANIFTSKAKAQLPVIDGNCYLQFY